MGKPVVGLVAPVQGLADAIYEKIYGERERELREQKPGPRWQFERNAAREAKHEPAKMGRLSKASTLALALKFIRSDAVLAIEEVDAFDEDLPRWRRNDALESIASHLDLAARHAREAKR
jgi:hypothetical protein